LRTGETGPAWPGRRCAARVLGSSITAKRWLRWAKRAEAGLTEEVRRRWGGEEYPARWRSGGGRLWQDGSAIGGSPAARGGGEGGGRGRCV
jgi:hypothetical protein